MVDNENINNVEAESCSASKQCCSSGQDDKGCCSSDSPSCCKYVKMVIFIIVILAACAVAYNSLAKDQEETTISPEADASFNTAALVEVVQSAPQAEPQAAGVLCGISLDSIASLSKMANENQANVAFILLADENQDSAKPVAAQINTVIEKLSASGKQVVAFTLEYNAQEYDKLKQSFAIESLPSVIVTGKGGGALAVTGEITESKLIGAFVKASTPTSCSPKGGSSCDPKSGCTSQ